jgi:hypothetical protein
MRHLPASVDGNGSRRCQCDQGGSDFLDEVVESPRWPQDPDGQQDDCRRTRADTEPHPRSVFGSPIQGSFGVSHRAARDANPGAHGRRAYASRNAQPVRRRAGSGHQGEVTFTHRHSAYPAEAAITPEIEGGTSTGSQITIYGCRTSPRSTGVGRRARRVGLYS